MPRKLPKLCRHKASNRAYVTDPHTGKEHFLGIWGTVEAQRNYEAWIQTLIARRAEIASGAPAGSAVSVAKLIVDYLAFARSYYLKNGQQTSEVGALQTALRVVNELCGRLQADGFGPSELKQVRQKMIEMGWARESINKQIQRVRRLFRWGVEHELVRAETLAGLGSVPGLRKGRSAARETEPIEPVPLGILDATLERLDPMVRAMCEIQLHSDMRPGELVIMRACDIDRREDPWCYTPYTHKTEHHERERRVYLGPKVRQILLPFLVRCPADDAWLFPSRARGKHAARRSHWTVSGIRRAVQRACEQQPILQIWHPNQLRHTQASIIRREYGIEAAQAILGHANLNTSEIYAERNESLARQIVEKIG